MSSHAFVPKSYAAMVTLLFSCLLFIGSSLFYTSAQNDSSPSNKTTTTTTGSLLLLPPAMGVKIASPAANERVLFAQPNDFKIVGTSTDGINTDCQVWLTLNDEKPYQNVTPTGPSGKGDYSTWSYSLNPEYNATIKDGSNKITSKLSCANPSNIDASDTSASDLVTQHGIFFQVAISSSIPVSSKYNDNNIISSNQSVDNQPSSSSSSSTLASTKLSADSANNIAPLTSNSPSPGDVNKNNNVSQTISTIANPSNINQLNTPPIPLSIKITSQNQNQTVPANKPLKISGVSSDNSNSNCIVYADWNDLEPMQKANASGPNGINDYSNWTFTYTSKYHLITEGTNELTSKLDCGSGGNSGSEKYYTVNVTGVSEPLSPPSSYENNNSNSVINSPPPFSSPVSNSYSDNDDNSDDDNNGDDSDDEGADQEFSSIDNGKDEKSGKDKENKKGPSGESNGKGPNGKGKNK